MAETHKPRRLPRGALWAAPTLALLAVLGAAAWVWREDMLQAALDPKTPFQTYVPPPAPDYGRREAWALLPARPERWTMADPPADVFFVHPTTYDGGREWNAPVDHRQAAARLAREALPNHAAPYIRVGRLFAPRYRQAGLYSFLTLRDDAREARRFAYADVRAAFRTYVERYNGGRAFLVVGVEQGGSLAARLIAEEVAPNAALRSRLVAAHLTHTPVPASGLGLPGCSRREEARCVLAFVAVPEGDDAGARRKLARALVWNAGGELVNLAPRPALCVNPLTGGQGEALASPRLNLGAANATGFEWGLRPGLQARQVGARCAGGVLRITRAESPSLRPSGDWAARLRAPAYNLFYADLEADARARLKALQQQDDFARPAPPIVDTRAIEQAPVHTID